MKELLDCVWTEKYRPKNFDELCLSDDNTRKILSAIQAKKSLPSFLLYSTSPGTGKTSTAKLISSYLKADFVMINASDDRGIDTMRSVKEYCENMSSNKDTKRCVFLDEADGLTVLAQNTLKGYTEKYANNVFFVLSTNTLNSIIKPVREGRTVSLDFSLPDKDKIKNRLLYICKTEKLSWKEEEVSKLIEMKYPDIRSMILELQMSNLTGDTVLTSENTFIQVMKAIREKDVKTIYTHVNNGLDIKGFVNYYHEKLYEHFLSLTKNSLDDLKRLQRVSDTLADIEKYANTTANSKIIFLSNILKIMNGVS